VLLTYLDESYTKERYLIAALMVPDAQARGLTAALDKVVKGAAWDYPVSDEAELHAHEIFAGKGDWQRMAPMIRARIGVYDKALQAIADHDVTVIIRSVDITGLDRRYPSGHDHPHSVVLTHLIERVDEYAAAVDERALLIADEVSGQDGYRRDLWLYQRSQTWGYRARKIERVVDTIHFAPSSSSRLVQAADLVAFLARRIKVHVETDERAKKANEALWSRIEPKIHHQGCWWPQP
jgi:hypothetical protein